MLESLALNYVRQVPFVSAALCLRSPLLFSSLAIFVTVLSGSLADVVKAFIDNPSSIETLLGRSIPGVGAYFLQLLTVKATVSIAVEAARPIPGTGAGVCGAFVERRDPPSEELKLGHAVPQMLMVVLVAVLYAAIAPLIFGASFSIFLARGARLPEAFTISIYKNDGRRRRRGVVSRARVLLGAVARDRMAPVWQSSFRRLITSLTV